MMDTFYIVISILFIVLLFAALVLWAIEARMESKRKQLVEQKMESGKGLRIEENDLVLMVKDGCVEIMDDLPSAPAAEIAPVAETDPDGERPVPFIFDENEEPGTEEGEELSLTSTAELTENSIVFERAESGSRTFIEKYADLTPDMRNRYDRLVAHILADKSCRKIEASMAVTFKYKTEKIMRAVIKRGVVVLNFMLANTELNRFVKEEGIKNIKISPVTVRLESDEETELAIQTADLTVAHIKEELDYKKERNRERRRQQRKLKAAQTDADTKNSTEVEE